MRCGDLVSTTTVLVSGLLLLSGNIAAVECCSGASAPSPSGQATELGAPGRAAGYEQWKLGTLSHVAHLLAVDIECQQGQEGDGSGSGSDLCQRLEDHRGDVSFLQSWAQKEGDYGGLLRSAQLHASAQALFAHGKYAEAEEAAAQSIVLQIVPLEDEEALTRWHTSLLHPHSQTLAPQRGRLADAFVLLAASCLETGFQEGSLTKLMKSHFALDTGVEISLLDNSNIGDNQYVLLPTLLSPTPPSLSLSFDE